MNTALMREAGEKWIALSRELEKVSDERDEAATDIERRAKQIAEHMRTRGHRSHLFTRTTEGAMLTGFNGNEFTFDVYDHYEDRSGMSFSLTAEQLSNPQRTIDELKQENREHELKDAREKAERAQARLEAIEAE